MAWRLEEVQVVLGHASRTTTERYARLAPDSIRRVANEAIEQWSDDSKVALGLVNAKFAIHPSARKDGATDQSRTDDLRFTKPLLYQLSYGGLGAMR